MYYSYLNVDENYEKIVVLPRWTMIKTVLMKKILPKLMKQVNLKLIDDVNFK